MTDPVFPISIASVPNMDSTDGNPNMFYPEDACQYVNDNFVAGKQSTTTEIPRNFTVIPPFPLPPRGTDILSKTSKRPVLFHL